MKKENRGGKRLGSGRPHKYNEQTKIISFRVPISKEQEVKKIVQKKLNEYKKNTIEICPICKTKNNHKIINDKWCCAFC